MMNGEENIYSHFQIDLEIEKKVINELKKFNSKFINEKIDDNIIIKDILEKNYQYMKEKLDKLIKSVSNKFILEKLCEEYYKTVLVKGRNKDEVYKNFYGDNYEYRRQFYRRDLKYIIENICLNEPNNNMIQINNKTFTEIIVLAEELLKVCGDLDMLDIFPKNSILILNHNKSYQQGADFYFLKTPCTIIDDIDSKFFDDKDLNYKKNCPKVFDEDIENICLNFFKDIYGVSFKELKNLFCEYVKERNFLVLRKKIF
jgi:hypothetical protein